MAAKRNEWTSILYIYICFDDSDLLSGQHLLTFCNQKLYRGHIRGFRSQSFEFCRNKMGVVALQPKENHWIVHTSIAMRYSIIKSIPNEGQSIVDDKRNATISKKSNARLPNECSIIIILTFWETRRRKEWMKIAVKWRQTSKTLKCKMKFSSIQRKRVSEMQRSRINKSCSTFEKYALNLVIEYMQIQ